MYILDLAFLSLSVDYHQNHLLQRKKDVATEGAKENMDSPNNSNSDANRCPACTSSFQACVRTADAFGACPSPLSLLLLLPETTSFNTCPDEDEGPDSPDAAGYESAEP